jgi:hypothetical protein
MCLYCASHYTTDQCRCYSHRVVRMHNAQSDILLRCRRPEWPEISKKDMDQYVLLAWSDWQYGLSANNAQEYTRLTKLINKRPEPSFSDIIKHSAYKNCR